MRTRIEGGRVAVARTESCAHGGRAATAILAAARARRRPHSGICLPRRADAVAGRRPRLRGGPGRLRDLAPPRDVQRRRPVGPARRHGPGDRGGGRAGGWGAGGVWLLARGGGGGTW